MMKIVSDCNMQQYEEIVDNEEQPISSKTHSRFKHLCAIIVVTSVSLLILSKSDNKISTSIFRAAKVNMQADSLAFSMKRLGYDTLGFFDSDQSKSDVIAYEILADYIAIIEPYSDMNLVVMDEDADESLQYMYEICYYDQELSRVSTTRCVRGVHNSTFSGSVNVPCEPYATYQIAVEEFDSSTEELIRESSGMALCLYVRRDIKTLTDSDLASTMDAMYTLWSVSEAEGQDTYGENFHSADWFTEAHMFNAAQRDSDHIHEGLGFLPQHVKISNMFELSIQAVNPAISLPYWDYTYDEDDLSESVMFQSDTFGSIKFPANPVYWSYTNDSVLDAAIPDGRWAYAKANMDSKFTDLTNAFGYMRGPWNTNPSPYISRFSVSSRMTIMYESLPTCESYYHMIQLTDLSDFLDQAPFMPHASTHADIGGIYGCDVLDQLLSAGLILDESSKRKICKKWSTVLKELYRADLISPTSDCSVGDYTRDGVLCGYDCDSSKQLTMVGELKGLVGLDYVPSDISGAQWDDWKDFICTGEAYKIFSGDHLEAASPSDPSFWPVHPNLERLLQAKLMAGGFDNDAWPTDASSVCDKSTCYEASYDAKGTYSQCCKGHYENDQLLDFVSGNSSLGYGETNANVLLWTDPSSADYGMPYIYDDFSWSHCDEDFPAMFDSLYSVSTTRA